MKTLFLGVLLFFTNIAYSQLTNIKAGLWSDPASWSNQTLPTAGDEVVLAFDLVVNINASCRSLNLNGHKVTVNPNVHFNITGKAGSPLLSKFIVLDTTMMAPFDTTGMLSLFYDDAGRNIRMDQTYYYEEDHTVSFQSRSIFFYHGDDTLPFKRILDMPVNKYDEYLTDTSFYFYNNGLLMKDSSIEVTSATPYWRVNDYNHSGNTIFWSRKEYAPNGDLFSNRRDTIHLVYANGNIVSQIDTSRAYSSFYSYSYDTHPNPFYRTQAKIAIENDFPVYAPETFIDEIFASNNAVEIKQTGTNEDYHVKFTYEYNGNGYPRLVWQDDLIYPHNSTKGIYIYKN